MRSFALVGALVAGIGLAGPAGTAAAAPDAAAKPAVVGATAPVAWGTCSADTLAGVPADQVKLY
ncbi:alpha/beta hydrolase, partial [Amycolatopsis sp. NPDC049252]